MRVMRILTRPNLGGPTRQAAALYRAHAALGVQTLLVVGRCGAGEAALTAAELGVDELAFDAAVQQREAARGLVVLDDLGRGLHPAADRRAARALARLLAAFAPDVVHTHTSKAGWIGRRCARAAGVGVVAHTFHGHVLRDYFGPLRSWLLARLEQRRAAATDRLFAVSASCARELEALGVAPPGRIAVLPPAIEWRLPEPGQRARARAQLGIGDDVFAVACAGRLVPIKRVDHFVAAVAQAPWLQGDVFGDGPEAARLRDGAPANLVFRGARPELPQLLPAYDALVLPSRREGYPLVAVEAFAAGVPVVGYDVPGVADALASGRGLCVPEADGPAGLAAALQRLGQDAALRQDCLAAGRAALPQHTPMTVARQLLQAYGPATTG